MRVFLPLTGSLAHDPQAVQIELPAGTLLWGCTAGARAEIGGDEEDLEYEAIQDAAHVAFGAGEGRAVVIAGDVPDRALADGPDEAGLFGLVTTVDARMRIASRHVSELTRAQAEASDEDPALLWFDVSEGARALAVAEHGPQILDGEEA